MRHKTITLCPTTYEIAKNMDNFSAWIRMELMKKHSQLGKAKLQEKDKSYGAYCVDCDLTFTSMADYKVQGLDCSKCGKRLDYIGELA